MTRGRRWYKFQVSKIRAAKLQILNSKSQVSSKLKSVPIGSAMRDAAGEKGGGTSSKRGLTPRPVPEGLAPRRTIELPMSELPYLLRPAFATPSTGFKVVTDVSL